MVNEPLIRLIMRQIEDTPEHWDQENWARSSELNDEVCKTTFCFAGWAAFLTDMVDGWGRTTVRGRSIRFWGYMPGDGFPFEEYAQEVLGLDYEQTDALFGPYADAADYEESREDLTTGQRIRRMKETIFRATGIDIP